MTTQCYGKSGKTSEILIRGEQNIAGNEHGMENQQGKKRQKQLQLSSDIV